MAPMPTVNSAGTNAKDDKVALHGIRSVVQHKLMQSPRSVPAMHADRGYVHLRISIDSVAGGEACREGGHN